MKQALLNRFKIFGIRISFFSKIKLFFWSCLFPFLKRIGYILPAFKLKFGKNDIYIYDGVDLGTFFEVFVFHEYELSPQTQEIKRILDLGANSGYTSIYFLDKFPNAQVVAVEADPSNAEKIRKNTKGFWGRILVEESAISKKTGSIDFFRNFKTSISGSTLNRDKNSEKITVSAISLSDLERKYGKFDIIKYDIEGGEWDSIFPNDLSQKPAIFIGEYHEDLTQNPHDLFLGRFDSYANDVRKISKNRFIINSKTL